MVAMYNVAGRQVGSHWLAIATLVTTFTVPFAFTGGKKADKTTPPINAASKDEEKFIQDFLKQVDQEDKAASKAAH
ncbi:hypothetical protein DV737_g3077, partial [Chaetothyriales sp. CBS 132003]